ncbi:MAG: c-type cytochrome domain-containing protein [Planctomycetaceae bacterium]
MHPAIPTLASVRLLLVLLSCVVLSASGYGDDAEHFFETEVRPLLHRRCVECHGPDKQQGELRLDLRADVIGDGGGGLAIAGKPNESRLIEVIRYSANDTQMPPKGKLPDAEIATLTKWIESGAFWPAEEAPAAIAAQSGIPKLPDGSIDFPAAVAAHWSYQPVQNPSIPTFEGWRSRIPWTPFAASIAGRGTRLLVPRRPPDAHSPRHARPPRRATDLRGGRSFRGGRQ